jgi:outer membrane protein assembly factor BamB
MKALALILAAGLAGCYGERVSTAYYSDEGGFVENMYDPGDDAVNAEVESLPFKHKEWGYKFNNRRIARMTLGGSNLYIETPENEVISMDRFTGRTEWIFKIETDTPLDWAPVEADKAPEEIVKLEEDLFAINRKIDDMMKEKGIGKETQALQKTRAEIREKLRVAAFGDNVYLCSRQVLYCLDRKSGNLNWTKRLMFVPSAQPFAIPTHVFVAGADLSRVWALSVVEKGDEKTFYKAAIDNRENHIMNRPVHSSPSLFFACHDGSIYCYDVLTGKLKWPFQTERELRADPILFEHRETTRDEKGKARTQKMLFLFIGGLDNAFYALDADAGALLWKYECGAEITTAAVAKDRTVYVKTRDGALHALDILPQHRDPKTGAPLGITHMKRNGNLRWRLPLGERFLVKGKDRVYVMGPKKEIFGMDEMSGAILGRWKTEHLQHLMTNAADDYVYAANSGGYVFCLKESKREF